MFKQLPPSMNHVVRGGGEREQDVGERVGDTHAHKGWWKRRGICRVVVLQWRIEQQHGRKRHHFLFFLFFGQRECWSIRQMKLFSHNNSLVNAREDQDSNTNRKKKVADKGPDQWHTKNTVHFFFVLVKDWSSQTLSNKKIDVLCASEVEKWLV